MTTELVVVSNPESPTVALRLIARGGARVESRPGVAWLTGRMLAEGTARRSWDQLAEVVESRGASLSPFGGPEAIGVAIDALADDWLEACAWAFEVLLEPNFPPDRFELARMLAVSERQAIDDHPELRAGYAFRRQLYGEDHPRGRPLVGEVATIAEVQVEASASFHAEALEQDLLMIAVGPFGQEEFAAACRVFERPPGRSDREPFPPWQTQPGPATIEVDLPGADQASLLIGHLSVPRFHPDRRALEIASVVLGAGAGLTGRIPHRVREREGLAYAATGTLVAGAGLDPGRVEVSVGTGVEQLDRAERAVREELERFVVDGPTEAEVDDARAYLLGSETLRRETARQLATIAADGALYGVPTSLADARASLLGEDRASVAAAVRRHLDPGRLFVTRGIPTEP